MIWWHAPTSDALQAAYNAFRRTALGARMTPVWSQMALHRPAEFNRSHIPAFMADEEVQPYVCVYPFVRSYDWYLLPDDERRAILKEHGMAARDYPDVRVGIVARQHRRVVRAGRLRVDPGVRGQGALSHRRPHARAARHRSTASRPRGDPVLHGPSPHGRRARPPLALTSLGLTF
jgi:hypothetical protein